MKSTLWYIISITLALSGLAFIVSLYYLMWNPTIPALQVAGTLFLTYYVTTKLHEFVEGK